MTADFNAGHASIPFGIRKDAQPPRNGAFATTGCRPILPRGLGAESHQQAASGYPEALLAGNHGLCFRLLCDAIYMLLFLTQRFQCACPSDNLIQHHIGFCFTARFQFEFTEILKVHIERERNMVAYICHLKCGYYGA